MKAGGGGGGVKKPIHVIPRSVAYGIAWIAESLLKLFRQKDYLVSTDAVFLSNVFQKLDNSKARRELQWNPRPISETVKDAVAWYAQREKSTSAR